MVAAISFQFEFQKKWKYQIIVFDLSIVSLDIAKLVHKKNVALINLKLKAFLGIFLNIPRNILEHSPESLIAFLWIFNNIPRNLLEHSPEFLITFPGIFSSIPQNATMKTFPGIL